MSECGHGNPFDRCDECEAAFALEAAYDRWLSEEYDRYLNEMYERHLAETQSESGGSGEGEQR